MNVMRALREWLQRFLNTFRPDRVRRDREDELRLHLEMAVDEARRQGLSPPEARRQAALRWGGVPQTMDALHDQRTLPRLDAVRSDCVQAWRQLLRYRTASVAAIVSLGLAIGATTAAYRLIDAVLLRPLPVAAPDRLFMVTLNTFDASGRSGYRDDLDYLEFRDYAAACGEVANSLLIGMSSRVPITFGAADAVEHAFRQYVSGNVFPTFGLRPAAGRLFTSSDDLTPGAQPVAVLSYEYWTRRFGRDDHIVGRTFRTGAATFEIIGVAPEGFTGTEPGRLTDIFLPSLMNVEALNSPGWSWFRMWVRPRDGVTAQSVRERLQARLTRNHAARAASMHDVPADQVAALMNERVELVPAGGGASGVQRMFRMPLLIVIALGTLVLLIACANVANLLATRAAARAREFALRVSIGASRSRLVQMVMVESALLAVSAAALGGLFAQWAAPFVVSWLAPAEQPMRLILPWDLRTWLPGAGLTFVVTGLLGLVPAIRVSGFHPSQMIGTGGERVASRGLSSTLVGAQMAFSVFVLVVATLFGATFAHLATRPLGLNDRNVLVLEMRARDKAGTMPAWTHLTARLRELPGVVTAAAAGWAPLSDSGWRATLKAPGRSVETFLLNVAPGFFDVFDIARVSGRDFGADEAPGAAIVNEAFVRAFFDGRDPVGRTIERGGSPLTVIGVVKDAVYRNVRDPFRPVVYLPMVDRDEGVIVVRTAGDPTALGPAFRATVAAENSDFQVAGTMPETALVRRQMLRERLLAALSAFFGGMGLLVAAVGLYGVLNAAVTGRRREIGIRIALGARARHVMRRIAATVLGAAAAGAVAGLVGGMLFGRVIDSLLFRIAATDAMAIVTPLSVLAAAAAVAVFTPLRRAVQIDPVQVLKTD